MLIRNNSPIQITDMFQTQSPIAIVQNRTCCSISEIFARAIQWLYDKIFCCKKKVVVISPPPPIAHVVPAAPQPAQLRALPPVILRPLPRDMQEGIDIMCLEAVNEEIAGFDAWLERTRGQIQGQMEMAPEDRNENQLIEHRQNLEFANERLAALHARAQGLRAVVIEPEAMSEFREMNLEQLNVGIHDVEAALHRHSARLLRDDGDSEETRAEIQKKLDYAQVALPLLREMRDAVPEDDWRRLPSDQLVAIDVMNLDEVNAEIAHFEEWIAEDRIAFPQINRLALAPAEAAEIVVLRGRAQIAGPRRAALQARLQGLQEYVLSEHERLRLGVLQPREINDKIMRLEGENRTRKRQLIRMQRGHGYREIQNELDSSYAVLRFLHQRLQAPVQEIPNVVPQGVVPPQELVTIGTMDLNEVNENIAGIDAFLLEEREKIQQMLAIPAVDRNEEQRDDLQEAQSGAANAEARRLALQARLQRLNEYVLPPEDRVRLEAVTMDQFFAEIERSEREIDRCRRQIRYAFWEEHPDLQNQLDKAIAEVSFLRARLQLRPAEIVQGPLPQQQRVRIEMLDLDQVRNELAHHPIWVASNRRVYQHGMALPAHERNEAVLVQMTDAREKLEYADARELALQTRLQHLEQYVLPEPDRERVAALPLPQINAAITGLRRQIHQCRVQLREAIDEIRRVEVQNALDRGYAELRILQERLGQQAALELQQIQPRPLGPRQRAEIEVMNEDVVSEHLIKFDAELDESRAAIPNLIAQPQNEGVMAQLQMHRDRLAAAAARRQALEARLAQLAAVVVPPLVRARLEALNPQEIHVEIERLERESNLQATRLCELLLEAPNRELQDALDLQYAELDILRRCLIP